MSGAMSRPSASAHPAQSPPDLWRGPEVSRLGGTGLSHWELARPHRWTGLMGNRGAPREFNTWHKCMAFLESV
jgi:hypothetical protein